MNHFVTFIDASDPNGPLERYVVQYHSVVLCDTMVRGMAVDFAARVRNDQNELRREVGERIEEIADQARREVQWGELWKAHHWLAQSLALTQWLIEDARMEEMQ